MSMTEGTGKERFTNAFILLFSGITNTDNNN